jgi:hypothetical protein
MELCKVSVKYEMGLLISVIFIGALNMIDCDFMIITRTGIADPFSLPAYILHFPIAEGGRMRSTFVFPKSVIAIYTLPRSC